MDIFAVVGPPHSGKSVLVRALFRVGGVYVVPAQPDGEGMWNQYLKDSKFQVTKGSMDNTQWSKLALHASNVRRNLGLLRDHAILDMGGRPTPDKADFLQGSQAKVVALIRSDLLADALPKWEALASKANTSIVAYLTSVRTARSRIIQNEPGKPFRAELTGLVRGNEESVTHDPVFRAFAAYLKDIGDSSRPELPDGSGQIMDVNALAYHLGVNIKPGHPSTRPWWEPGHVRKIWKYVNSAQLPGNVPIRISGPSPNFVVAALSVALYRATSIYPRVEDPKLSQGYMQLHGMPIGAASGPFKHTMLDDVTYVNLNPKGDIFTVSDVKDWVLPDSGNKAVILGGHAPNWLYALAAVSYSDHVPWIGVMQPQLLDGHPGYVIVYANNGAARIGETASVNPPDD